MKSGWAFYTFSLAIDCPQFTAWNIQYDRNIRRHFHQNCIVMLSVHAFGFYMNHSVIRMYNFSFNFWEGKLISIAALKPPCKAIKRSNDCWMWDWSQDDWIVLPELLQLQSFEFSELWSSIAPSINICLNLEFTGGIWELFKSLQPLFMGLCYPCKPRGPRCFSDVCWRRTPVLPESCLPCKEFTKL